MAQCRMLLTAALALAAPGAWAEPATPAEAQRIEAAFHWYFGTLADAVAVAPQGEAYALTLAPQEWAALLPDLGPESGMTVQIEPLVFDLRPRGGGLWAVALDQPWAASLEAGAQGGLAIQAAQVSLNATFDEGLMMFRAYTGVTQDLRVTERDPWGGTAVTLTRESRTEGTASADLTGALDLTLSARESGISSFTPGGLPGEISETLGFSTQSAQSSLTVQGLRWRQLAHLAHRVAEQPLGPETAQEWGEWRILALGALPVVQEVALRSEMAGIGLATPAGAGGLAAAEIGLSARGLVAQGQARLRLAISGADMPPGLTPDWARPVLPQSVDVTLTLTDYNAAAPLAFALSAMDWPIRDEAPPAVKAHMTSLALPKGSLSLRLEPGAIAGAGYRIAYEGEMAIPVDGGDPTGRMTLSVTGLDRLMAAAKAAPDGAGMALVMGMGALRGIAEAGPDGALVWQIDATTPGRVLINGLDMAELGAAL